MSSYVYGVVSARHPATFDDLVGVGDPPTRLRRIEAGSLAAIAGDAPENLRAKRRDLLAHELVLERMCAQGATLPMRFGLVAEDDSAVANALGRQRENYAELLSELDGRMEVNVKAAHREDAVLAELLAADEGLRARNEWLRAHGGTQEQRVEFGQQVASALDIRRKTDAERVLAALRALAVAESEGPEIDGCFVNTSFLVEREDATDFDEAIEQRRSELGAVVELSARGPLPPYSFAGSAHDQPPG